MNPSNSIPVYFVNATQKYDFTVYVYGSERSNESWRTINAQSSAYFKYNTEVEVGATYRLNGLLIMSGPFIANPGSVWKVQQNTANSTAILSLGQSLPIILSALFKYFIANQSI